MDIGAITSNFSVPSADWLILGGIFLFLTFDSIRAGVARVTAISIALPIALLVSESIDSAAFVGNFVSQSGSAVQIAVFLAIAVMLFIAMYRITDRGYDSPHLLQSAMAGAGGAIICILVLLQLPESALPWSFGPTYMAIFGEAYRLYWFIGAYFLLATSRA